MSNFGPSEAFLFVGGKNLSGDVFNLREKVVDAIEDARGLGQRYPNNLPVGVANIELEAKGGLYDDRVGGIIQAFQGQGQTRQVVTYGLSGTDIGATVVMLDGIFAAEFDKQLQRDGLTKAEATFVTTGEYLRGQIVSDLTPRITTTGNTQSTPLDGLAPSTDAVVDLQLLELTLATHTDLSVEVVHSADNAIYTTMIALDTPANTAAVAKRASFVGTVQRYVAVAWEFNGAGAGPRSAVINVSIHR